MVFIQYLHLHKFIYRDLKPNNIIFDTNKTVIVIDFDRMIECTNNEIIENDNENITTQSFTHSFIAPEIVSAKPFSYEADIYSLGFVIYYILYEKNPLNNNSEILSPEFSKIHEIYEQCTNLTPQKRPSLSNLIKILFNDFYSKISPNLLENDSMKSIENFNNGFIQYLIYISENKNFYSLFKLGRMYQFEINVPKNYKKAFHYYTLSEILPESHNNIALMYIHGQGVEKNFKKAIHYYELAAKQNFSIAQFNLGLEYAVGKIVPFNLNKAIKYLTLSSNQNIKSADFLLGLLYDISILPQAKKKALNYFMKAAKFNIPEALCCVGNYYLNGIGVEKNLKKAFEYYLLAAEQKFPFAYYFIGHFYYDGIYVPKNIQKAYKYYSIASNYNIKDAQSVIGNIYFYGNGMPQDYDQCLTVLKFEISMFIKCYQTIIKYHQKKSSKIVFLSL